MKRITLSFLTTIILLSIQFTLQAQELDAGGYMTSIDNAQAEMRQKYMAYMSAVAHSRRARKIEKMRMATLESINNSKYKTADIAIYKGDNSLRKSSMEYIELCYRIFNEDYKHIVDMEEIAEQSFDEMQAYMLVNEKTNEKIKAAADKMHQASMDFAKKYNVTIVQSNDALGEKLAIASKLNSYHDDVFLIFFKCSWQDGEMTKAMNNNKLKDVEQARNSLIKYAEEGLTALDTLKSFNGDPTLAVACREALVFYKKTAQNDIPKLTDYILKQEEFAKAKKTFEAKSERSKQDVDAFNKSVKEINAGANNFNQLNNNINNNRNQVAQNWNNAEKTFSDANMPHYK